MHPQPNDRASRRHGPARPELQPGQIVTWAEVSHGTLSRRIRPAQGSLFPRNRSPDRQRSLERRRRLAASGPMPPQLACQFTTGQLSVLRIVSDEVRRKGRCTLYVDEIAARAGVSHRHAQAALRWAEELRLLRIVERRLTGTRNDTNVVTIISAEWLAWLRLKRQGAIFRTARTESDSEEEMRRASGAAKESGGVEIASSVPRDP